MSGQTSPTVLTNHVASDAASEVGLMEYIINAALSGLRTAIPVQVISVSNNGGLSPIGTVDLQPLISAVDGSGNLWPHGVITNVPYMRIQGGANGIILDPQVNDIGIATVCDRDISTVQNVGVKINPTTGHNFTSAPGSTRKNDMSDMVYLMTIIGAAPTQYVQFNSTGIHIVSPVAVTVNAPTVSITATNINTSGTWNHTGTLTSTGDVTAVGTHVHTHTHGGVTTGSGTTGAPSP